MLRPANTQTYDELLRYFQLLLSQDNLPREKRGYIERTRQPPITHFLNISIHNHQNVPTRIGHISMSPEKHIHLDILAWMKEEIGSKSINDRDMTIDAVKQLLMQRLRQELMIDVVSVAKIRQMPEQGIVLPI